MGTDIYNHYNLGSFFSNWTRQAHGPESPESRYADDLGQQLCNVGNGWESSIVTVGNSVEYFQQGEPAMVQGSINSAFLLLGRVRKLLHDCKHILLRARTSDGRVGAQGYISFVDAVLRHDGPDPVLPTLLRDMHAWSDSFGLNSWPAVLRAHHLMMQSMEQMDVDMLV